jgi:Fe2+ or Zn2+ uptake regulation protein
MKESQLKEVKELFSEFGYHFTEQRNFICQALWESREHYMTGREIYEYLKGENDDLCLSTVYRAINSLEEIGILRKVIIENRVVKYKICFDRGQDSHGHLICQNCGKIIQLESENLNKLVQEVESKYNFTTKNQIVNFNGLCVECQAKLRD